MNIETLPKSQERILLKLERDLIKDSILELRFNSALPTARIFPTIFNIVSKEFPNFKESDFPVQLRTTPQFEHLIIATLFNEEFSIGFSSNSLAFNCVNGYKGWEKYSKLIKTYLKLFYQEEVFNEVTRIGMRYINVFQNETDLSSKLSLNVKFKGIEYYDSSPHIGMSMQLNKGSYQFNLIIADTAIVNNTPGSLLDIDVYTNNTSFLTIEDLFTMIENIHDEEKLLFENILTESFINDLKPTYK